MSRRLAQLQHQLRHSPETRDLITAWREMPAQRAISAPLPGNLADPLRRALAERGITSLFQHQALAISSTTRGENVAIVTPTASGKSLCYDVPILQQILVDDAACALCLFPTKALAHDQLATLTELTESLGLGTIAHAYDGDTPPSRRRAIRDAARIMVTNPDMLHVGILPNHTSWERFWRNLAYVVIDEIHNYRGVFGSHVANVLRRLRRVCAFYGSNPRFICTSATIANPGQLAVELVGSPVRVVSNNGAPRGPRTMVLLNPPIIDQRLGLRLPLLEQVEQLANALLHEDIQTVIFCQSRRAVERLVIRLRQAASDEGRDPVGIRGYRGGYLPHERREIEHDLRAGIVRGIVATNALELGIDIGGLEACIMAGYPGTIAATWQRAGRASRGMAPSLAILVASDAPSDQYIVTHPEYILGRPAERALIHPDNLYLLLDHLRCATAELPMQTNEDYGREDTHELLSFLAEGGEIRTARDQWIWCGRPSPAQSVSLRSASSDTVTIMAPDRDSPSRILGTIDRDAAPLWVHEGAIYMHQGAQHLITSLDWDAGIAMAERHKADYFTEASQNRTIEIIQALETSESPSLALARGDILLTRSVKRYRRVDLRTHTEIGHGAIDIPDQESYNQACWMMVPDPVVAMLDEQGWWTGERRFDRGPNWAEQRDLARKRDGFRCANCGIPEPARRQHEVHHIVPFGEFGWRPGRNENYCRANALQNLVTLCPTCHRQAERQVAVQSSLAGLSRVMGHVIPLLFMCDRHDIGLYADVRCLQTKLPTIFCYDTVPGGVGLSDQVMDAATDILMRASDLVSGCGCDSGCPSCVGPATSPNPQAKQQVIRLVQALLDDKIAIR